MGRISSDLGMLEVEPRPARNARKSALSGADLRCVVVGLLCWLLASAASAQSEWRLLPGLARDIGVGKDGSVWIIGTDRQSGGYGIYRWIGSSWRKVPGAALRIAVDPQGAPWVVNDEAYIYRWLPDGRWQRQAGRARDIGIGADGSVWVIGTDRQPNGYGIYRWTGSAWQRVAGAALRIAVGPDGMPWVVNDQDRIYRRQDGRWQSLEGQARDLDVGADGTVWVIGTIAEPGGYRIHRWTGAGWQQAVGAGVAVAAGPGGWPWRIDVAGRIYRYEPPPVPGPDAGTRLHWTLRTYVRSYGTGLLPGAPPALPGRLQAPGLPVPDRGPWDFLTVASDQAVAQALADGYRFVREEGTISTRGGGGLKALFFTRRATAASGSVQFPDPTRPPPLPVDHYTTTDVRYSLAGYAGLRVEGWISSSPTGPILSSQRQLVPLRQFWHPTTGDHFLAASETSLEEARSMGYRELGSEGFVGSLAGTIQIEPRATVSFLSYDAARDAAIFRLDNGPVALDAFAATVVTEGGKSPHSSSGGELYAQLAPPFTVDSVGPDDTAYLVLRLANRSAVTTAHGFFELTFAGGRGVAVTAGPFDLPPTVAVEIVDWQYTASMGRLVFAMENQAGAAGVERVQARFLNRQTRKEYLYSGATSRNWFYLGADLGSGVRGLEAGKTRFQSYLLEARPAGVTVDARFVFVTAGDTSREVSVVLSLPAIQATLGSPEYVPDRRLLFIPIAASPDGAPVESVTTRITTPYSTDGPESEDRPFWKTRGDVGRGEPLRRRLRLSLLRPHRPAYRGRVSARDHAAHRGRRARSRLPRRSRPRHSASPAPRRHRHELRPGVRHLSRAARARGGLLPPDLQPAERCSDRSDQDPYHQPAYRRSRQGRDRFPAFPLAPRQPESRKLPGSGRGRLPALRACGTADGGGVLRGAYPLLLRRRSGSPPEP